MKNILYWLLVLTVFMFCPVNIAGLDMRFLTAGRFIALGAICTFMFAAEGVSWLMRTPKVDGPLMALLVYMLFSTQWSESPQLTLYKTLGYALVSVVFLNAGAYLGEKQKTANPFSLLAPTYIFAVVSSIISVAVSPGTAIQEGKLFGYTGNPNYLGAMFAFSSPWILYYIGSQWGKARQRFFALSLAVAGLVLLIATRSRTSLAMTMVICFVASSAKGAKSRARFAPVVGLALILLYATGGIDFVRSFIYKDYDTVFQSRTSTWGPSIEAAQAGGALGVGFGVSYGLSHDWDGELQSGSAGREKGHSQLAVIEEIGVVGFIGYLALLNGMRKSLGKLRRGGLPLQDFTRRLTGGFLLGSILHSALEGWFTSPGSPETALFWVVMGLGLGGVRLGTAIPRRAEVRRPAAIRRPIYSPAQ